MIAIIDYGAGNIFSVKNALDYLGVPSVLTKDKSEIESADSLILPGVGAFPEAMKKLGESGLIETVRTEAKKKPFLGICLGMQMIFDKGYEFGVTDGLGLIHGTVEPIEAPGMIIPHMGWNSLEFNRDCPMLSGVDNGEYVYFVHSFAAKCSADDVAAYTEYSGKVTALVYDGKTVFGSQFHPEKSGAVGMKMLKNFAEFKV